MTESAIHTLLKENKNHSSHQAMNHLRYNRELSEKMPVVQQWHKHYGGNQPYFGWPMRWIPHTISETKN